MSDEATLIQSLKSQLLHCAGFDGDTLSSDRKKALDAYFQRPDGNEVVGGAQVVSGDVSAMVEATVAAMMEAFSSDRICEFDPIDSSDESQAQLESDAVQYYVMKRENGFLQMTMAIKEALLLRNGVIKIEAADKTERKTRRLGNVEPEALTELISGDEVVDHDYNQLTGELSVTIKQTTREFVMTSESLENFLYFEAWHMPTLTGIPICALRHLDTRADLVALGYDSEKIAKLTQAIPATKVEEAAKNPGSESGTAHALDSSQEMVEWYECYVRVKAGDGDELRRIALHYVDGVILDNIAVSNIRFASGTCILNPHRFTGISLWDKLRQNQDLRTGLRRALLDNVTAVNKSRLAVLDGVVNPDDVADGRVNTMVRVKRQVESVQQAVMPIIVQDTSMSILANLESAARERSEMGGAALDMQQANVQMGDRMGSQGLDRAYSVAEQLSAAMMKTISATLIRDTFLLAHATLREHFDEPLPIKRNGKWTHVRPSEWPERRSVTIKPGMSVGERSRRANAMGQVIDSQLMMADKGMDEVLVNLGTFNRALLDWARLMEVQNPEQYYLDPESDESQAALKKKDEARKTQSTESKTLMQNAFGLEQLRVALGKYDGDADRALAYWSKVMDTEVEEAKIVGGATTELLKQQREGLRRASTDGKAGTTDDNVTPIAGDIDATGN